MTRKLAENVKVFCLCDIKPYKIITRGTLRRNLTKKKTCLFSVQIQMNPEDDIIYPSTFTPNYIDQANNNIG